MLGDLEGDFGDFGVLEPGGGMSFVCDLVTSCPNGVTLVSLTLSRRFGASPRAAESMTAHIDICLVLYLRNNLSS